MVLLINLQFLLLQVYKIIYQIYIQKNKYKKNIKINIMIYEKYSIPLEKYVCIFQYPYFQNMQHKLQLKEI